MQVYYARTASISGTSKEEGPPGGSGVTANTPSVETQLKGVSLALQTHPQQDLSHLLQYSSDFHVPKQSDLPAVAAR